MGLYVGDTAVTACRLGEVARGAAGVHSLASPGQFVLLPIPAAVGPLPLAAYAVANGEQFVLEELAYNPQTGASPEAWSWVWHSALIVQLDGGDIQWGDYPVTFEYGYLPVISGADLPGVLLDNEQETTNSVLFYYSTGYATYAVFTGTEDAPFGGGQYRVSITPPGASEAVLSTAFTIGNLYISEDPTYYTRSHLPQRNLRVDNELSQLPFRGTSLVSTKSETVPGAQQWEILPDAYQNGGVLAQGPTLSVSATAIEQVLGGAPNNPYLTLRCSGTVPPQFSRAGEPFVYESLLLYANPYGYADAYGIDSFAYPQTYEEIQGAFSPSLTVPVGETVQLTLFSMSDGLDQDPGAARALARVLVLGGSLVEEAYSRTWPYVQTQVTRSSPGEVIYEFQEYMKWPQGSRSEPPYATGTSLGVYPNTWIMTGRQYVKVVWQETP